MSTRVSMVLVAILALLLVWMIVPKKQSSVPHAQNAESVSSQSSISATPNRPINDQPEAPRTSPHGADQHPERSPSVMTEYDRLKTLEQAALQGNASAQFKLSNAMRHCATILAYSEDSMQSTADSLRRNHLLQSRDDCRYFAGRREQLIESAFEWERRALEAGDPSARAMQIAMEAGNGSLQADQIQESLRALLASNDPFVFGAVAMLSMTTGVNAESAAWHMLACENEGPPELCTIMNGAISDACTGAARCGNTSHEVDVAQYYMHAHPELFDIARGRYQELKAELQHGRYGEIDLQLTPQTQSSE